MKRGKELLFYRTEEGMPVWQYGHYRAAGIKWMLANGWKPIEWMNAESEGDG